MTFSKEGSKDLLVCHKSHAPAKTIFVVRVEQLISHPWETQLALTCLQGLINRKQPRIFIVQDRYDELWLEWLRERGDIENIQWIKPKEAFKQFLSEVQGIIVIDPKIPASINIGTMLAGVKGWLVVAPVTIEEYSLSWPAKTGIDLRSFHWKKNIDGYRWFYDQYWDQLSHRMVAMLDPYDIPLRDYMVEFKIPLIWVSTPEAGDEMALAEEILKKLPPNIPCLGWPLAEHSLEKGLGEYMGVTLANEYAKFEVCSGYEIFSSAVSNLSVHSGTVAQFQRKILTPPSLKRKVYFSFIRTDGDGPNFQRDVYRKLWDDPQHGRFPIGWQIGPTCYDLMPDIIDYYYKHAKSNDCFVNAVSGIGYIHEDNYAYMYPDEQREQIWKEYLYLSKNYRQKLDLSALCTHKEMSLDILERFCKIGFTGVFANYTRSYVTSLHNQLIEVAGIPVFRACNRSNSVDSLVADMHRWIPRTRPAFAYFTLTNWMTHMEYAERIIRKLGPEYVPVTPDQLVELYGQSKR